MRFLIFDVGGFAIKYALMNAKADIIERGQMRTPLDSITSFFEIIGSIYDNYKDQIQGISFSMPGRIDSDRGYAYTGGFLKYNNDKEIVSLLQERCPVSITIENDGKCAALAELWMGSLADCNDGVVVVLGSGIAGGIIKDKKLYKGCHLQAGEFSHVVTNDEADVRDQKYHFGYRSGYNGLCHAVAAAKELSITEVNGQTVFDLANQGDEKTLQILDDFCRQLVIQLYNLHYILDPEKIAIGGGISAQDLLFNYIYKYIEEFALSMPKNFIKPKVVKCRFGNDSNLIGALYSYLIRQGLLSCL